MHKSLVLYVNYNFTFYGMLVVIDTTFIDIKNSDYAHTLCYLYTPDNKQLLFP